MDKFYNATMKMWASAIALRISDEWNGNTNENKEDVFLLKNVLENVLVKNPDECVKLIGTTIIEESYFDKI
ncbi:MAG TPA: hypothetical protein DHW42_10455 [Candidatus Marinimicrobia bacterium]|nr:hypothetical protein [Candidatus Neomarinimicrobiota bacterium]